MHLVPADATQSNSVWVAKRVPDGHFVAIPNVFTIREIDFEDHANYRAHPKIREVAKSWGAWKEGEPFDFSKIFSGGE